MPTARVSQSQYERLATLRHSLRRFLRFSHEAARAAGLHPQQHQAMLAIKGAARQTPVTVGYLARRLGLRHHSAVGLVDRLARRNLARRRPSRSDRRQVHVELTPRGQSLIRKLSAAHLRELRQLGPELRQLLEL